MNQTPDNLDQDLLHFFSEAFQSFDSASEKLADAYADLEKRLENVNRELERTNQELSQSLQEKEALHNQLACILESMTAAVVAVNLDGNISLFNRSAEQLMGKKGSQVIGQPYAQIFGNRPFLLETLTSHQPYVGLEGSIKTLDTTEPIPVQIGTVLIQQSDGQVLGALEMIHDISERKELEEQLGRSTALAELGRMAAEVAHDLRNPLGAIRLYAGMLQQELTDDRKQLADSVVRGLDTLESITYNLLSLARPIKPSFQFVDFTDLVQEVITYTRYAIIENEIQLIEDYAASLICYGDFEQLKQIVLNIILNAVQAMPEGGELSLIGQTDEKRELLVFCVKDTGCGIPSDIQEKIFTPFFTTKPSGSGLGLHTVNRIVQAHFGRIRVESQESQGTSFYIELQTDARQNQLPVFEIDALTDQLET